MNVRPIESVTTATELLLRQQECDLWYNENYSHADPCDVPGGPAWEVPKGWKVIHDDGELELVVEDPWGMIVWWCFDHDHWVMNDRWKSVYKSGRKIIANNCK